MLRASPIAQRIRNPPAMQETQEMANLTPGSEDPLEKEVATHSIIVAWGISWTEEPGGLQSMGSQRVGRDWVMKQAHSWHLRLRICSASENHAVVRSFFFPILRLSTSLAVHLRSIKLIWKMIYLSEKWKNFLCYCEIITVFYLALLIVDKELHLR